MAAKNRLKRLAFSLAAVMIGIVAACALTEVGLRLADLSPATAADDPVLGVHPLPGEDHDSRGFRNVEAQSQADIVVLGDSQTYGNNAEREEAWPQVIGQRTGLSVYQMAYGGWSAPQYRALVNNALELKPKILIVAFYTGNDLLETTDLIYRLEPWEGYRNPSFVPHDSIAASRDVREALETGARPGSFALTTDRVKGWLQTHSRLYLLLRQATHGLRVRVGLAETEKTRSDRIENFLNTQPDLAYHFKDDRIPTILSPAYRFRTVDLMDPDAAEGWRLTRILLSEIRDAAAKARVRFLLVLIPTKELTYLELMRQRGEPIPPAFDAYDRAERNLSSEGESYCAQEKLQCVFTLSVLTSTLDRGVRAYAEDTNGHPTAEGYAAIAREVQEALGPISKPGP